MFGKSMIQVWWKAIRWLATLGVMLWFVALPLMPVYGAFRPWPQAQEKLREQAVTGLPLMIGAGRHSERHFHRSGDYWREEKQRSYVVFPDSFLKMEIFTYSESAGSGIKGVETEVIRSRWLIPLFVLWILAGLFTVWKIRSWFVMKSRANSVE